MTRTPTDIRPIELSPADKEYQGVQRLLDRFHDITMMGLLSSFGVPADVIRSREAQRVVESAETSDQ